MFPQPTQWHTSAAAPEPHDSTEGGRASSSQGASASGRQPIDYIFGFLPGARQQELASARDTPGVNPPLQGLWVCREVADIA